MTTKKVLKVDITRPKSGAGKAYDHDYSFVFDKREAKKEPLKGRVLTSIEQEFWSGLTS